MAGMDFNIKFPAKLHHFDKSIFVRVGGVMSSFACHWSRYCVIHAVSKSVPFIEIWPDVGRGSSSATETLRGEELLGLRNVH